MKAALLIGINYKNTSIKLDGCINDVNKIHDIVENNFKFTDITKITDDDLIKPTYNNILSQFNVLLNKINNGCNEVWIHYSGHGYRIYDTSNDEVDNYDEVIVPLDYTTKGFISDDLLNRNFLKRITNPNAKIFIFFDCCNSGTNMDLQYQYKNDSWTKINNTGCMGQVVYMSGCRDDQDTEEMYDIGNDKLWAGAMTTSFLTFLKNKNYNVKLGDLFYVIKQFIQSHGFKQIPQICCNYKIDMETYFANNVNISQDEESPPNIYKNDTIIKQFIHIYKRYEYLANKYKNNSLFYNYYNSEKNKYLDLVHSKDSDYINEQFGGNYEPENYFFETY